MGTWGAVARKLTVGGGQCSMLPWWYNNWRCPLVSTYIIGQKGKIMVIVYCEYQIEYLEASNIKLLHYIIVF
jgi:hypothetical protein